MAEGGRRRWREGREGGRTERKRRQKGREGGREREINMWPSLPVPMLKRRMANKKRKKGSSSVGCLGNKWDPPLCMAAFPLLSRLQTV